MTDERFDTKRLLVLRKLTRSIAEMLREQVREHVATLTPLLRPRIALGDPADAGTKEPFQLADKSFKELAGAYEAVAKAPPFNLRPELRPPLELASWGIELSPMEYVHVAMDGATSKSVKVTSPLKWALSYTGLAGGRLTQTSLAPRALKDLLANPSRPVDDIRLFVLHYLTLDYAITRQASVGRLLDGLHLRLGATRLAEFGPLPIPFVASAIRTVRPPDDVLIEHTEISGMDAFEEVVDVDDIANLRDPLGDRLRELVTAHGAGPASGN